MGKVKLVILVVFRKNKMDSSLCKSYEKTWEAIGGDTINLLIY